jgi:hypothetical protein
MLRERCCEAKSRRHAKSSAANRLKSLAQIGILPRRPHRRRSAAIHICRALVTPRSQLVAVLGVVLAVAACSDTTKLLANFDTITDTLDVYALSGSPPAFPTALVTPAHTVVRADAGLTFDIAFDIDGSGRALLYPFKTVVDPAAAGRRVGIRVMPVQFDSLLRAPNSGYNYDSVTVAPVGTVLVVQATRSIECQFDITPLVYSKIVIDDVDVAARRITFRMLVDPDCGFRDLVPGRPKR